MPVQLRSYRGSGWHEPQNKHRAYTKAKITTEQVREIRGLLAQGKTTKEIANLYGISIDAVYNIKSGKTWGDVR